MKKILNAALLTVAMVATGCYGDKGNYDYHEINMIGVNTAQTGTYFAIDRYDTLRISPELTFTQTAVDESDLEYKWEMFLDDWASAEPQAALLSTEKNLNVQISREASTKDYAVILTVKQKSTGACFTQKYTVNIQPSILSGMLIMQDDNGHARLDYLATTNAEPAFAYDHHVKDVISSANDGMSLSGIARGVSFSIRNVSSYDPQVKKIHVWTDKEVALMEASDFSVEHTNDELFFEAPAVLDVNNVVNGDIVMNAKQLYYKNPQSNMPHDYQMAGPLIPNTTVPGPMELASYIYTPEPDNFSSMTGFAAIVYDTKGNRFVKIDYNYIKATPDIKAFETQEPTALFDVNNMGSRRLVWFGKGNASQGWSVFADGDSYALYRTRFNINSTVKDESGNDVINPQMYNVAISSLSMNDGPEISSAFAFEPSKYANVLLYASPRNLYVYELSSKKTSLLNDPFPENEEITCIKIYNTASTQSTTAVSGTILYVATWDGTNGKVYEFAINRTTGRFNNRTEAAEGDLKKPLNVFTGFGKIVSMCVKNQGLSD